MKLLLLFLFIPFFILAQNTEMALIKGGKFIPLYGVKKDSFTQVGNFYLDKTPVTNIQFLDFVNKYPRWKKSAVKKLFADGNYLRTWTDDISFSNTLSNSPATNISWFAAKSYCECLGKRLPTTNEWEYAAMADESRKDARKDSLYTKNILSSYETPKTYLKIVGQSTPNYWGVYDLHGIVWEWTIDFNSVMISGENRDNNDTNLFCGAGSFSATDLMNYAAFIRYAFRNSLKANYTITNLGFRCAKDL